MEEEIYEYDFIFSLAGEHKDYAQEVASYLDGKGVKVWFYLNKEVDLWGRNMVDEFSKLFTESARHCVIFISKEYTEKVWPNLERQYIQSRWIRDPHYLLPVRFDKSLVIGIPDTIACINLRNLTPAELGEKLIEKLENGDQRNKVHDAAHRIPKLKRKIDPLAVRNQWVFYIVEELKKRVSILPKISVSHDEIKGI